MIICAPVRCFNGMGFFYNEKTDDGWHGQALLGRGCLDS